MVKSDAGIELETPLSRLRSISIAKSGVSFSSNLVLACASRGIRLYVLDWRGINVAALCGQHQHAVADLRRAQFKFLEETRSRNTAAQMIFGKIRNQRAVLLYFNKYLKKKQPEAASRLSQTAEELATTARKLKSIKWHNRDTWREEIMGYEGAAASRYWQGLASAKLLPSTFKRREGRGALEISNQLLNYGYTLLTSYIWSALDNAGFELYAGILHTLRPGKPAFVLDVMEEYRPWVVDRNVIKLRSLLSEPARMGPGLKKSLSAAIHETMATKYPYRGKRLRLETILQRQCYRLGANIVEAHRYQPYRFRW